MCACNRAVPCWSHRVDVYLSMRSGGSVWLLCVHTHRFPSVSVCLNVRAVSERGNRGPAVGMCEQGWFGVEAAAQGGPEPPAWWDPVSALVVSFHHHRCVFSSQESEEPKVTQGCQVLASEARWAPPESQVGVVSVVSLVGRATRHGCPPAHITTGLRKGPGEKVTFNYKHTGHWIVFVPSV